MTLNDVSTRAPMIVVAAALGDGNGRFLMQRRPSGEAHGGLWEFPGGKLEPGEAPPAALARELTEELGIAVDRAALRPSTFASAAADGREMVLLLYRCDRWSGTPRALAASALCWGTPAALARLPMPPLDVPLVAALGMQQG